MALVLASMLLPALVALVPLAEGQPAAASTATSMSLTDSRGMTLSLMTDADALQMMERVGTRADGVNYDVIVDGYHTGLAPPSAESWESMVGEAWIAQAPATQTLSVPSAYDMSTNSWFPKVGNQGSQGSCAAWAATYYCYGAVEAKDNGWTGAKSGTATQLLSPAWTYNRVAYRGLGGGSWMSENFQVIRDWGVSTLSTFPYTVTNDINWGTPAAWREAPLHRGSQLVFLTVNDGTINTIKSLVAGDQPVTFAIDANQFDSALNDNFVISADEYNLGGKLNHAQTIVGFNDSLVVAGHPDVGAFRVVNSWGSSWGDAGYYWISYDAFDKIMNVSGNELSYITDIPNYVPSLLAVWHFNSPPKRNVEHILSIGSPSFLDSKTPYYVSDSLNQLPSFMVCDISEFRSYYDSGATRFNLEVNGGAASVISSFRIESYEGGYSPGAPTQVSGQSAQVPKSTPGNLDNIFPQYSAISPAQALDRPGIEVTNPDLAEWVGVEQTSIYGGSAMQAGDAGDSYKSTIQISVTGYSGISFFWKVSSEPAYDFLRFYESTTKKLEISGNSGWRQAWYNFTSLGTHTLKWSYEKSSATSSLRDSAWIDCLQFLDAGIGNDSTPPITTLTCIGDVGTNSWYRSDVNAVLSANDAESGVYETKYRLDSSPWMSGTGSININGNGVHLLEYYSTDFAGNAEAVKSKTLKIDTSDPIAWSDLVGTEGLNGWYTSEVEVDIIASDGVSGVSSIMFSLDGSAVQAYPGAVGVSGEGAHALSYYPVDNAGNVGEEQSVNFSIDTILPIASCALNGTEGNGSWFVSSVHATIRGLDGGSGIARVEYCLDRGDWQNYSSEILVGSEGQHSLEYRAVDGAGNVGSVRSQDFAIDTHAPESLASINGIIGEQGWYVSPVEFAVSANDGTSGVAQTHMRVNGGDWSISNHSLFEDGVFAIEFYSTDVAGNAGSVGNTVIMIDLVAPSTSHLVTGTLSESGWFTSDIGLELTAGDGLSGINATYYRIDGGEWTAYEGAIVLKNDGTSLIEYWSSDLAGNLEPLNSLTLKLDKTAPASSAEIHGEIGAGGWYVSSLEVNISAIDELSGVASVNYRLDSGDWQPYSGNLVVEGRGPHVLEISSQDRAGNVELVKQIDFRIDTDVPTVTSQIDGRIFTAANVRLDWTSNDSTSAVGAIELSLDGAAYQMFPGTQSNITLQGLGDGPHTLVIRATDLAGNRAISSMSFVVDTNPLSPQGPYGLSLLIILAFAALLVVGLLILRFRRR